jgi:hypothetical protein
MQVSHKNQYVVNLIFFMFLSVHIEQISWVFAAMNIFRWWFSHSPVSGDVPQKTFSMRFSSVQSGIGWTFISVKCISGEDMQSMHYGRMRLFFSLYHYTILGHIRYFFSLYATVQYFAFWCWPPCLSLQGNMWNGVVRSPWLWSIGSEAK